MLKKQLPNFYSKFLYKMGPYFLDRLYNSLYELKSVSVSVSLSVSLCLSLHLFLSPFVFLYISFILPLSLFPSLLYVNVQLYNFLCPLLKRQGHKPSHCKYLSLFQEYDAGRIFYVSCLSNTFTPAQFNWCCEFLYFFLRIRIQVWTLLIRILL